MRKILLSLIVCGAVSGAVCAPSCSAQSASGHRHAHHEVDMAFTFDAQHREIVTGGTFWEPGAGMDLSATIYHGLGAAIAISGGHTGNIANSGVALTTITTTFGPRYTWSHHKVAVFGQALVGESHGINSVFPNPGGAVAAWDTLALQTGGGLDLRISHRFAVRALEASWVRTQFPNATTNVQNSLQLGAGIVWRVQR